MAAQVRLGALVLSVVLAGGSAVAQTRPGESMSPPGAVTPVDPSQLQLSTAPRTAILNAVRQQSSKVRPPASFSVAVGEMVPPSIELYVLPDSALAEVPEAKSVKYTVLHGQVVLVDPTNMRIIDVLR